MVWRLMPHGVQYIGKGPLPRRQQGGKSEDKASIIGGHGKRGSQHGKNGQGKICHVPRYAASLARVVFWRETDATISP